MTMVASSFEGLVLKSFMGEIHKHVYQKQTNNLDVKAQNCCEKFLNFFKGVLFYNVSHISGTQDLSKVFQVAMLTNHQGYNLIRSFEKYEIFRSKNEATFNRL